MFHSAEEGAGRGPHPARHLASAGRECSWPASPEPWICRFALSSRRNGYLWMVRSSLSQAKDSSMVLMADRPSCPRRLDGRGRPCVGPFASFAPPSQFPSRPVSHSSTHVLDTVTEKECAACELPAVVTSAATISLHRSTHMLAEGGSWATKRWHRRSSLKRNQARVPWLLEFIRQYRGGHGSGAVGAGLWRRSERRPH